ncbi:hypothetical protein LTR10_023959 [Elasticomyces elasticus]|uniref:Xylanolytic transcriptional activator regulatory domain-containing protein n=1 Tax=Exophiala sideris TaxID=1016849 RepID=A0ABR0J0X5_9EURO|nr:hypothetical protein LTR10_023959 [Elasticomyces elasticus]KAK5023807.1 hypothetical protein LTS07_008932 [Exophiala sideris]KAK5030174.1 hypothetical protein LTR13_008487 [Exophiala sideris]KAK5053669.1 hypothetical protein LTR69_009314 [Exophiala sideris]KAK5179288.1 hypothetical protein LTR44_008126 [Eurotiomycetes sp. CCFEE 6388]
MKLNCENASLCWLAQESRRRVLWAIYILDTKVAGGLQEFTLCPVTTVHVQLPCREEDFEFGIPQITGSLDSMSQQQQSSSPTVSLLSRYIRMMNIRDRILRFTKHAAGSDSISLDPRRAIRDFEGELQSFSTTLPPSLVFSVRNLRLRAFSPDLSRYIMIHVWWHQCHCDLYRLLFAGLREALSRRNLQQVAPDLVLYCRSRCVDHARAIAADIFAALLEIPADIKVMDGDIAVCAYQSARILVHAQRTNDRGILSDEDTILEQVGHCSAVLKKMCANVPSAGRMRQDIDSLVAGGLISESSLSGPGSPQATAAGPNSVVPLTAPKRRQILSRHSFVKFCGFTDDSARLVASLDTNSPSQSTPTHPTSVDQVANPPISGLVSDEGIGDDWAINDAYQGVWGEPLFDPLTSGVYYQQDWDMQDFMQGDWMGIS